MRFLAHKNAASCDNSPAGTGLPDSCHQMRSPEGARFVSPARKRWDSLGRATESRRDGTAPTGRYSLAQRASAGPEGRRMPHTYCTNLIHCVFSTKERADSIADDVREQLFAYIFGIAKNLNVEILAMGGTANHVHILIAVPAKESLSNIVRDLKANSSRWMSDKHSAFSWQQGFGAFSVSPSQAHAVKQYIRNQAQHHKKRNFEEEFLLLLKKSGVDYDPQYVFG